MRARQFIFEYNQQATAQRFGDKLLQTAKKDPSPEIAAVYEYLNANKEIRSDIKANALISVMQAIEACDPTKNKEYMVFLAKMYAQDDLADFVGVVEEYPDPEEKQQADKGTAKTVFENDQVRIVVPEDQNAACYYGQGTRWCTAAKTSSNYFNHYNSQGPLYILLPKNPKHDGEKYQLHFESEQFMDENDYGIEDIVTLLEQRFGNLVPWFQEHEPAIRDWVMFARDEDLKEPLIQIGEIAMEHVWDTVNDWEHNDDYWYDWLRKEGYVYPEGHEEEGQIDWDKVSEADVDYLGWNYDANDWYLAAKQAVEVTPLEARRTAEEAYKEEGELITLGDLEKVPAMNVREAFLRSRDGDGGLEEWLYKRIMMQKDGDKWVAKFYTPPKKNT